MAPTSDMSDALGVDPSAAACADNWLADCARRPSLAHEVWAMGGLAPVHCTRWLAAEVPLVLALRARERLPAHACGPLLVDVGLDCAWWLVPLGADVGAVGGRGVSLRPHGWPLHCPPASRPAAGRRWLVSPDGSGCLTDPVALGAATGPGLRAEAFG
ncbi:hypothetical protein ABZ383_20360 [Streptomyces sp. NPDC005900]|uniref:hypothetical protein n=1 Tax=unclassified Streptomyces TaxID=2593676 RepID=UPI0033CEB3A6